MHAVTIQMCCHCGIHTQIWSWLVIMWMLSEIITISFKLYLK